MKDIVIFLVCLIAVMSHILYYVFHSTLVLWSQEVFNMHDVLYHLYYAMSIYVLGAWTLSAYLSRI